MRVIHKYELAVISEQYISVSEKSRILHLGVQSGKPMIWVMEDPSATKISKILKTFGTGEQFDETILKCDYIGSYVLADFVGHVVVLAD